MKQESKRDVRQRWWNKRAALGVAAGTDDVVLKRLEMNLLACRVPPSSLILDVGCGRGETLIFLAKHNNCRGVGIDYAPAMIEGARDDAEVAGVASRIQFINADFCVSGLPEDVPQAYDCAITERYLVNVVPELQQGAFDNILRCVRVGGRCCMIETFSAGLDRLNDVRRSIGLDSMAIPWHNDLLDEHTVSSWCPPNWRIRERNSFASTYYLLSRVVYARLAADRGDPLCYDAPINLLAEHLPAYGDLGAPQLWIWENEG